MQSTVLLCFPSREGGFDSRILLHNKKHSVQECFLLWKLKVRTGGEPLLMQQDMACKNWFYPFFYFLRSSKKWFCPSSL